MSSVILWKYKRFKVFKVKGNDNASCKCSKVKVLDYNGSLFYYSRKYYETNQTKAKCKQADKRELHNCQLEQTITLQYTYYKYMWSQ